MTREELIMLMARAMVAANQGDWPKPAPEWTEIDLFKEAFYNDAAACYDRLIELGMVIQPKQPPKEEPTKVLAEAIAAVFPNYRRMTAEQAAAEIISKLSETRHEITQS